MSESPWRACITAGDYERHMQATGQPQANADLLVELFRNDPPPPGAAILFPGAGTGQIFDYLPPGTLAPYPVTCTDINPSYLERLASRLPCATAIDDIEAPTVRGPFDLAIVVLVLEHVDWRAAVAGICRIAERVFTIIQENPPDFVAPTPQGTMANVQSRLVERAELIQAFRSHGLALRRTSTREVPDAKKMIALDFSRRA
jgi:hypothetical protein